MTADRDPAVGALLDQLTVDPPSQAFWGDLLTRLESGEVAPLHRPSPATGRSSRRRRVVAFAAAAAAVLVAVVVGSALRDDRDGLEIGPPVSQPDATTPTTTEITTAPPSTAEGAVRQAVSKWLMAIRDGDADRAWGLMGPQSQESIGRAAFEEQLPDLALTWARWLSRGETARTAFNMGSAAEPRWWTVTFDDPVTGDLGVMMVRLGADTTDVDVEPFIPGPALGLIEMRQTGNSGAASQLVPGEVIEVRIDVGVAHSVVAFDDTAVPEDLLVRDLTGAIVGVHVPSDLGAGSHIITVGVVMGDGTLAADVRRFGV